MPSTRTNAGACRDRHLAESKSEPFFPEADCFKVYRQLRSGVSSTSHQLGQGYNLFPSAPMLMRYTHEAIDRLAEEGRLSEYTTDHDAADREIYANVLGRLLHLKDLLPEDVIFANGGTEAISMMVAALPAMGLDLVLPLPCYYAYEQSAIRHGVSVSARYRDESLVVGAFPHGQAVVTIMPNAVTGFAPANKHLRASSQFEIIDIVTYLAALDLETYNAGVQEMMRDVDLSHAALILTPSKDLSLPALRTAVIVTKNRVIRELLTRDRYERSYSISPLVGQIAIAHVLACNLSVAEAKGGGEALAAELTALRSLGAHWSIDSPRWRHEWEELVQHLQMMRSHLRLSMEMVESLGSDIFEEVSGAKVNGFSCFPRLRLPIEDHRSFAETVNRWGRRHGLRINPTVLFGGTFDTWDSLFPGEPRVRVNLSVRHTELQAAFERLLVCVTETVTHSR